MLDKPRVYADLNKWEEVNGEFRVILTTMGTHQDLRKYGIAPKEGIALGFWMDDGDDQGRLDPLYFDGILRYDESAQHWVAVVDRSKVRNASERRSDIGTNKGHSALEPVPIG